MISRQTYPCTNLHNIHKPLIQTSTLLISMAFSNSLVSFLLLFLLSASIEARKLGSTSTIAQFLNPQNAVRAKLRLPPLKWSNELVKYAKKYAEQRRGDCALVHSTFNYGENLFWGQGSQWRIADAVKAWADEKSEYNYHRNKCVGNTDCLHYTQMVWKNTKRVGCVRMVCNSGDTYIVCEYDPHGNVIGQRPY